MKRWRDKLIYIIYGKSLIRLWELKWSKNSWKYVEIIQNLKINYENNDLLWKLDQKWSRKHYLTLKTPLNYVTKVLIRDYGIYLEPQNLVYTIDGSFSQGNVS